MGEDNCELIENPNLLGRTICNKVSIVHSTNSPSEDYVPDVSTTVYVTMERMESGTEAVFASFKEIFKYLPEETE